MRDVFDRWRDSVLDAEQATGDPSSLATTELVYAAPLHSCRYRWLHAPAISF